MPSPTKSLDHTARLLAQIAELSAQRDQLITDMLPLIPADVLASAQQDSDAETKASDSATASATVEHAKSDTAASSDAVATASTFANDASSIPVSESSSSLNESTRAAVLAHADHTVKQHISRLHAYNGIRDIGQNVMGLLAEQRGVRVVQVMEECGVGEGD